MAGTVQSGIQQILSVVSSGCSQVVSTCRNTASSIASVFSSVNLYSSGVNMMSGLINGLNSMRSAVMATASSIASDAAKSVNSALQIHSPSRLMVKSGQFTGQGLVLGMQSMKPAVEAAAQKSLAEPVVNTDSKSKSLRMPEFNNRTSIFGAAIQRLSEQQSDSGSTKGNQETPVVINFSPTLRFNGGNPDKTEVQEAVRMSQREFEKMMKEYLRNKGRVSFA